MVYNAGFDLPATPCAVHTFGIVHVHGFKVSCKSPPDGTGGHPFFCKGLGAFLQWSNNVVGNGLLGLLIGCDCQLQPGSESTSDLR